MTGRQQIALRNHCRLAVETAHPSLLSFGPLHSIVLSVNSGYE